MKARAFSYGTGRLDRLSLMRTRRGGAMMARLPYRRISRSIRPKGGMTRGLPSRMDLPDLGKERRN